MFTIIIPATTSTTITTTLPPPPPSPPPPPPPSPPPPPPPPLLLLLILILLLTIIIVSLKPIRYHPCACLLAQPTLTQPAARSPNLHLSGEEKRQRPIYLFFSLSEAKFWNAIY